jgi:hypothetical protein
MEALLLNLPAALARNFTADPARWLLKARSPLVKYRAAVDLLGWPRGGEAASWWERRYEDHDLAALAEAQAADGLWYAPGRLFRRRGSLYAPRYLAAVWQLPVLADFGLNTAEPLVARAAGAMLARRTADGFFDLGPGGPFVRGNAYVVSSLAALGVSEWELARARDWLRARRRGDGGWADRFELGGEGAPSTVATTAEVLRALAGGEAAGDAALEGGKRYLIENLFTDYNGRFPRSARGWRRLSWPQYRYDALTVGTSLAAAGASRGEVAPLAEAVRARQTRRGFWRQQVPFGERCWLEAVRAGRASRWITYRAALFLLWFWRAPRPESDCDDNRY